ncbi:MAG TPA: zf-HC2 domain-containing protein, partial [Polyangiales bacterium]|nr:zf-HC2 domain-containing protein [Polyangiales bacterium]
MQTEHLDDELLQRHFDGDLDRAEAAAADAHLQSCGECTRKRAELAKLSDMIAASVRQPAAQADFAGMFARIEQGIAAEAATSGSAGNVVSIGSATRKRRNYGQVSALIGGLAVAAVALIMVYRPGRNEIPDATVPSGSVTTTAPAPGPGPAPAANPPGHSEVVDV